MNMPRATVSMSTRLVKTFCFDPLLTLGALLTTSNAISSPNPVRAATLSAKNIDRRGLRSNSTLHIRHSQIGDRDTSGRGTGGRAILIVLLNDDTILCDAGKCDILIRNIINGTGCIIYRLDADTILRVRDGAILNDDAIDGVVLYQQSLGVDVGCGFGVVLGFGHIDNERRR